MLLALAVSAVLAAEPTEPSELEAEADGDVAHERARESEHEAEHDRVFRISATLLGGALGIAAPLLAGWAGLSACRPGCSDTPVSITAALLPLTLGFGLAVPHWLNGGRAGVGFGLAGAFSGYLSGTALMALISALTRSDWAAQYPAAGAGLTAGLALVGAVAAMETRHAVLEDGAGEWRFGRMFAVGAACWLPMGLAEAGIAGGVSVVRAGGDTAGWIAVGATALNLVLGAAAAWGTHVALGGRGTFWSALTGMLASSSLAVAMVALHGYAPPAGGIFRGGTTSSIPVILIAAAVASAGPSVGLEWSNARQAPEEKEPFYTPTVHLNLGVTNGGGSVGLSGTF